LHKIKSQRRFGQIDLLQTRKKNILYYKKYECGFNIIRVYIIFTIGVYIKQSMMFVFNTNMMRIIKPNCVKSTPFTIIFLTYKKLLELLMRFSRSFFRSHERITETFSRGLNTCQRRGHEWKHELTDTHARVHRGGHGT